jgi:hypothetical protein
MALLFIDGFDHYDPQALDPAGDPWLARGKATVLSQYAERIPGRRPSSYALRLPEGSGGGYVKTFDSGRGSLIVGAAIRVAPYDPASAAPVLLGVLDATTAVRHVVSVTPDGRVQVLVGDRRQHRLDDRHLAELIPDLARRDVYVCGPERFVGQVTAACHRLGVPRRSVHHEAYAL